MYNFYLFVILLGSCCLHPISCKKRKTKNSTSVKGNVSGKGIPGKTEWKRQKKDGDEEEVICDATDDNFVSTWNFKDLLQKDQLDIRGTRFCRFIKKKEGCVYRFQRVCHRCPLEKVMAQLFPGIDLLSVTKKFIVPEKFILFGFELETCKDKKITMILNNRQEHSLACRFLKLKKGGMIHVIWKYEENPKLEDFGFSGDGKLLKEKEDVPEFSIRLSKDAGDGFINATLISPNPISCISFARAFGIDLDSILPKQLANSYQKLQLDTLSFETKDSIGAIFPDEAFEFTVSGKTKPHPILSSQKDTFFLVQYFQESDMTIEKVSDIFPRIALYAHFSGSRIRSKIHTITGLELPPLCLLKGVSSFAFSVASKDILVVFNRKLKTITNRVNTKYSQFVATSGMNFKFLKKGVKDMLTGSVKRTAEKENPNTALFMVDVKERELVIRSGESLITTMKILTSYIWNRGENSYSSVKYMATAKVMFNSILYIQSSYSSTFIVEGNITDSFKVVGPFSLSNVTFQFITNRTTDSTFGPWMFNVTGKNSFLDVMSLVSISEQDDGSYVCEGNAKVFSMEGIRNRTGASYLTKRYEKVYNRTERFSFSSIRYVAQFGAADDVLRLKGQAYLPGNQDNLAEILYWMEGSTPHILVGLVFFNEALDTVLNHIFGNDKLVQTWMTFNQIGIVFSKSSYHMEFDSPILKSVVRKAGIHIVTSGLQLNKYAANDTYRCMAEFLKAHFGTYMQLSYDGESGIIKSKDGVYSQTLQLNADIPGSICAGSVVSFSDLHSEIQSVEKGEVSKVKNTIEFKNINLKIPGVIFVDGSEKLQLAVNCKKIASRDLLGLDYVKLSPLKMNMEIPHKLCPKVFEMESGMKIGTNENALLDFPDKNSKQSINFESRKKSTFVGIGRAAKLVDILTAFNIDSRLKFLNGGKCLSRLTVAYSGGQKDCFVPDIDRSVTKGLHFFCTMEFFNGQYLETQFTVKRDDQILVKIFFEKPIKRKNFVMSYSSTNSSFGPVLHVLFEPNKVTARLLGLVSIFGLERKVELIIYSLEEDKDVKAAFQTTITGDIYDEIPSTVKLSATGADPLQLSFSYDLEFASDITREVGLILLDKIREYYTLFTNEKAEAQKIVEEVTAKLKGVSSKRVKLEEAVKSYELEVQAMNRKLDAAALTLSQDCLDSCRTVSLPSLSLSETCSGSTSSNAKCYEWRNDVVKALDVTDLIKCQAKKLSTYLSAKENITTIQLLVNNVIKTKANMVNLQVSIDYVTKMKDAAVDTMQMLKEKMALCEEMDDVMKEAETHSSWFQIEDIRSSGKLENQRPPTLPFHVKWTLNGKQFREYLDITFLLPMQNSTADHILNASFPDIHEARNAVDQALLRHQQQKKLKNELQKLVKSLGSEPKSSKRSIMENRQLLRQAEPVLPQFSILSDSSILGFRHLSPWALLKKPTRLTAKRQNIYHNQKRNFTVGDANNCFTAKRALQKLEELTQDVSSLVENYNFGKSSVQRSRDDWWKRYEGAAKYVEKTVNSSGAVGRDLQTMRYWLYPVHSGLTYWEKYSYKQLENQNKHSIAILGDELDHSIDSKMFGGLHSYLDYLGHTWSKVNRRGFTVGSQGEDNRTALAIPEGLKEIFGKKMTLEEAQPRAEKLLANIAFTKTKAQLCS